MTVRAPPAACQCRPTHLRENTVNHPHAEGIEKPENFFVLKTIFSDFAADGPGRSGGRRVRAGYGVQDVRVSWPICPVLSQDSRPEKKKSSAKSVDHRRE